MTTKRLIIIIVLLTALGLITAWQQIQTVRHGYKISNSVQTHKQLLEAQRDLDRKLARVKSPDYLVQQAEKRKMKLTFPDNWNIVNLNPTPEEEQEYFAERDE